MKEIKIIKEGTESYHVYMSGHDCWINRQGLHALAEECCKRIINK